LTNDADADLAWQHASKDFSEDLQPAGCWQTHVSDRWCSVNGSNGLVASVPDDTYTAGSIDWCFPSEPPSEMAQHLLEAISEGSEHALVAFASDWAGTVNLNIRTYGYFFDYQGSRDLLIPVERIQHLTFELARIWNDFATSGQISFVLVHPQPSDSGVDLHLIVYGVSFPAQVLLLLDVPNGEDVTRRFVSCLPAATGFSVLVRSGHDLIDDARYNF